MRYLFQYLEVCLGKIVADNEVGALVQALAGGYVEPGPGGDPIRCALHCRIDFYHGPMITALQARESAALN